MEAVERLIVLAPFLSSPAQRGLFLAYFAPTLLTTMLLGVLIGIATKGLGAFRRLERGLLLSHRARPWGPWIASGTRLVLLAGGAGAVALLLRPTYMAIGRGLSAPAKRFFQRHSPDGFEFIKAGFQWVQSNGLIVLGLALIAGWMVARWSGRRLNLGRFHLSHRRAWGLALLALILLGGAFALDSRYYFSIYERSVHLPLFVVQLGLGLVVAALIHRTLGRRTMKWIKPVTAAGVLAAFLLTAFVFIRFDDDQSLKALFWSRSVVARRTLWFLQWAIDGDRDGSSPVLGGGDGDDRNPLIHPLAREVPDNGIDENGLGGDLKSPGPDTRHQTSDIRPTTTDQGPRLRQKPPGNILLISIDALRADHLGCYGYRRATSPRLDRLARSSHVFLNAYAQGTNTGHSFASMLRSAYGEAIFDEGRATFIEILEQHGYATASFSAKRMEKWLRGRTWKRYKPTLLKGTQFHAHSDELGQWDADELTTEMIAFLKAVPPDRPQFIWAHYLEPHFPYRGHLELYFGDREIDRYDSEIARADQSLGRLFESLEQSGALQHTLVIITADHGEAFYEHGQREHSSRPYQEQIHVPLIIRSPGQAPVARPQPVGLIDLGPTILRFAGIDPPAEYEGVDLLSPMTTSDRPIFSETPRNIPEPGFYVWAMMDGSWKLMYDVVGHTFELYDLQADPGERRNLIDADPDKARQMMARFGQWFDRQSLTVPVSDDWSIRRILKK
jgi:arylsulfatase A-like enzyme